MRTRRGLAVSAAVGLAFGGLHCERSTYDVTLDEIEDATTVDVTVRPEGASATGASLLVVELRITEQCIGGNQFCVSRQDSDGATRCPVIDDRTRATANDVPMALASRGGELAEGEAESETGCTYSWRSCYEPRFELDLREHPELLEAQRIDVRIEGEGASWRARVLNPALPDPDVRLVRADGSPAPAARPGDALRFEVAPPPEVTPGFAVVEFFGRESAPAPGHEARTFFRRLSSDDGEVTIGAAGLTFSVPEVPFAVGASLTVSAPHFGAEVLACEGVHRCSRSGADGNGGWSFHESLEVTLLPNVDPAARPTRRRRLLAG